MTRFLINFVTFSVCLTFAVLVAFYLSCLWAVIALLFSLFMADQMRLLR